MVSYVSKSWQLVRNAINPLSLSLLSFLLLFSCESTNGQEPIEKAYYDLVKQTMAKDTAVDALTEKFIRARMATDRMTKEDSIKYYNMVRNRKLILYKSTCNETAKRALKRALEEKRAVRDSLAAKTVETALKNIPSNETTFDAIQLGNEIELTDEQPRSNIYHKFSSPTIVDVEGHQYLIYHLRSLGRYNYKTEIIIFSVRPNGNYNIDESILLSYQ